MTDVIRTSWIWFTVGWIGLAAASTVKAQVAAGPDVTPFKAVYKLDFGPAHNNSPFKGGQGHLTVELTGSRCTDYRMVRTTNGRLNTDRGALALQSEAVFAENAAGSQLAFSLTERSNGKVSRQYNLVARKNDDGVTLTSRSLPGGRAGLPKGTLLPIEHERMAVAAASSGRKAFAVSVYNPEDTITSVEQMSYAFGPESTNALPKGHPANIEALRHRKRQRIELIFRNPKTGKIRVSERMTRFNDNSILTVSEALTDDLRIKASLETLTLLPAQPCP